jgi:lipid-A-disaccharide synthase
VVIPTVEGIAGYIHKSVENWPVPVTVTLGPQDKYDGFAAAKAALAASGTVSLELAMARLPMVIAYRVSPITAFIATKFLGLRVEYASILNILSGKMIVPEFLQENCKSELLAQALEPLFHDGPERLAQSAGLVNVVEVLGGATIIPSQRAANAVIEETQAGVA